MILYEIPAEIANLARVMLVRDDERFYFVSTVDQMRYGKRNGVHVSTKLLGEAFGDGGRKRVMACFKECVSQGLLTCDDRYKPAAPGNPGFAKTYCLAQHLLHSQDLATDVLRDAVEDTQHRDGPSMSGSSPCVVVESRPVARCIHPAYIKIDEGGAKRHREKMKEAMKRLGWDCVPVDVTQQLGPSLKALECPMTDADVAAYYHAKGVSKRANRRRKVRFDASSGILAIDVDEEETLENSIGELRKSLRNLAVGNVRATRKNGRCYHTATAIPTEYRRRSRFRMADGTSEAAVDVDVSAMHWWELSTMIKDEPQHADERRLLAEVFATGTFYEFLRDQLLTYGANLSDRELEDLAAFKKAANAFILFGKRDRRGSLQIAFREALPGLAGALRAIQSNNTLRQESFILTRLEGTYTLDFVMTMMHDMGIPCLPYHDGCLVPESAVQVCIDLYRQAMMLIHGHAPLIRAKGNAVSSEDLEVMMIDDYWGTDDDWQEDHAAFQAEEQEAAEGEASFQDLA